MRAQTSLAFYEAVAQVLPVLLVALVIDLRVLGRAPTASDPNRDPLFANVSFLNELLVTAIVISFAAGEFSALRVLYRDTVTGLDKFLVMTALALGGFTLLVRLFAPRTREFVRAVGNDHRWKAWVLIGVQVGVPLAVCAMLVWAYV